MELWTLIVIVGLVKIPMVGLLLWMPFRSDDALADISPPPSPPEDGGSRTLPQPPRGRHPREPLPRNPRRGPHGGVRVPAPQRARTSGGRSSTPTSR